MIVHTRLDTAVRNDRGVLAWAIHDAASALARLAHRLDPDAPTMSELWSDRHDVGARC